MSSSSHSKTDLDPIERRLMTLTPADCTRLMFGPVDMGPWNDPACQSSRGKPSQSAAPPTASSSWPPFPQDTSMALLAIEAELSGKLSIKDLRAMQAAVLRSAVPAGPAWKLTTAPLCKSEAPTTGSNTAASTAKTTASPGLVTWSKRYMRQAWDDFHSTVDVQNPPQWQEVPTDSVLHTDLRSAAKWRLLEIQHATKPMGWEPSDEEISKLAEQAYAEIVQYHLKGCPQWLVPVSAADRGQNSGRNGSGQTSLRTVFRCGRVIAKGITTDPQGN